MQSGRRNVDLDLAFSHKKRGTDGVELLSKRGLWFLVSFMCPSVSLSSGCSLISLFASFGALQPQTQEELQASNRWHVSSLLAHSSASSILHNSSICSILVLCSDPFLMGKPDAGGIPSIIYLLLRTPDSVVVLLLIPLLAPPC